MKTHSEWFKKANYEDPNFKVQMPIFSIHGNHDDPAGVRDKKITTYYI